MLDGMLENLTEGGGGGGGLMALEIHPEVHSNVSLFAKSVSLFKKMT